MGRCLGRTGVGLLFQILQQGPWFLQKRVVLGKVRNVRGQEPERVKEMQLKASLRQREIYTGHRHPKWFTAPRAFQQFNLKTHNENLGAWISIENLR